MKKIIYLTLLMMFLTGCGVARHTPPTVIYRDSVRTEIHERIIRDTVDFVPPEFFQSYTSTDTLSVLENTYAKSVAVVHDGLLSHTLESVPNIIRIPVEVPVRDTLVVEKQSEKVVEYVEVEKKLTKWQSLKMRTGGYAMLAVLIFAIFLAVREFIIRKK